MTKSNYSDDKNPHSKSRRSPPVDRFGAYYSLDAVYEAWKAGYLVCEEERDFTEGEKKVMRKMLLCFNWDMAQHDFDMFDVESLKKKVLGE